MNILTSRFFNPKTYGSLIVKLNDPEVFYKGTARMIRFRDIDICRLDTQDYLRNVLRDKET